MSKDNEVNPKKEKSGESKPKIRYVPVDMRAVEDEDEQINVFEVLGTFWYGRKTIFKITAIFAVVGLVIALISAEEYTSNVRVLPETQSGISLGGLSGIAQQFGLSASPQQNSESISANIYPTIISSNIFVDELMESEVPVRGNKSVTIEEYVKNYQRGSIIRFLAMMPFRIKKWLTSFGDNELTDADRAFGNSEKLNRLVQMSNEEWEILRIVRERISATRDSETGVVTISAKMQDPLVAAAVADEVVQKLSKYITEKRTEKARRELEFINKRFAEAKTQFEESQKELAEFNDQNRGQLTAMARTDLQLLQSRYDLNFNLYNSMAERVEEARIKVQEETPVINVLEPAAVPDKKSEPNRTLILIVFTIVGGIVGCCMVFATPFLQDLKSRLVQNQ